MPPQCEAAGCQKRPSFNLPGSFNGRYCASHKDPEMVNVKAKTCAAPGCRKHPIYNTAGETRRLYCADHKAPEMVDVKNKACAAPECRKIPNYNTAGETHGLYCAEHKESEMVNVRHKTCTAPGCRKQPRYNTTGETHGMYCVEHKEPEMVDVKNRTCAAPGCRKQPKYNITGETRGLYCVGHKESEMIDVITKACAAPGCRKQPIYNTAGETHGLYCVGHKEPEMVDVKNKACAVPGCKTRAWCGIPGNVANRCAKHKENGMIKYPRKKCTGQGCREIAIYGISIAKHCESHRESEEKNLIEGRCAQCGLESIVKADGSCSSCGGFALYKKYVLDKQLRLKKALEASDIPMFSYDKIIDASCNRKRPDFVFDAGTHFVVVECDEHQHNRGGYGCEQTRMWEIMQALGLKTVFIRHNPDSFKSATGRPGRAADATREKVLLSWLKSLIKTEPEAPLSAIWLYYDGWSSESDVKLEAIPPPEWRRADGKEEAEDTNDDCAASTSPHKPCAPEPLADEELDGLLEEFGW